MLVYIAGAGALGSRFGVALSKAGHEVILLDNWPEHIEAIRDKGLMITGDVNDTIQLPIMRPTQATREADLVLVLTKSTQLRQMLNDIQPIIGEQTKLLCLLNGLGHIETLHEFVRKEQIIMGVTVWTAGLIEPGQVELRGSGSLTIQCLADTERTVGEQLVEVLNQAGLNATYTNDVLHAIWKKAMINGTMNATSALLDANLHELLSSSSAMGLVRQVLSEFIAVAAHYGLRFDLEDTYQYIVDVSTKVGHHYPSMHQDLVKNKRLTEVDYLNGFVAQVAETIGSSAPYCRTITQLVHAKEDINQR
ncbi:MULTISPECIES: 2-dehydropantoate 2-reductase [unclassified Streptococcus]|uniref:2-dehydropantoate 2-reductase n=1 Tax=unclassified Streptococcus TaxID=2608887 RepID=UPI00359ED967